MPTNDERREVAENLRNMCICGCRYKEEFYDLLVETVMRAWDFHEFSDVADRLAELIEPEERRCHAVRIAVPFDPRDFPDDLVEVYQFRCSECSVLLEDDWSFCPNCGAKVIQE